MQHPYLGLIATSTTDPDSGGGVTGLPYEFLLQTADSSLWVKTGASDTAWTKVSGGGGGGSADQEFRHTCDGTEGSIFDINLPTAMTDANYDPHVSMLTATYQLTFNTPVAGISASKFQVVCSSAPAAGDVLAIFVKELTA